MSNELLLKLKKRRGKQDGSEGETSPCNIVIIITSCTLSQVLVIQTQKVRQEGLRTRAVEMITSEKIASVPENYNLK